MLRRYWLCKKTVSLCLGKHIQCRIYTYFLHFEKGLQIFTRLFPCFKTKVHFQNDPWKIVEIINLKSIWNLITVRGTLNLELESLYQRVSKVSVTLTDEKETFPDWIGFHRNVNSISLAVMVYWIGQVWCRLRIQGHCSWK